MHVETYATVHQLVTTITAQLRSGVHIIDTLRQCFPPGYFFPIITQNYFTLTDMFDKVHDGRPEGPEC